MHSHAYIFTLMAQIKAMAEDVQPLLAEVRDCGVLKEVENLTQNLIQASDDLRLISKTFMALVYQQFGLHASLYSDSQVAH